MLYPILMYHFRCEQELLYYFCQFNIYLYLVISEIIGMDIMLLQATIIRNFFVKTQCPWLPLVLLTSP